MPPPTVTEEEEEALSGGSYGELPLVLVAVPELVMEDSMSSNSCCRASLPASTRLGLPVGLVVGLSVAISVPTQVFWRHARPGQHEVGRLAPLEPHCCDLCPDRAQVWAWTTEAGNCNAAIASAAADICFGAVIFLLLRLFGNATSSV